MPPVNRGARADRAANYDNHVVTDKRGTFLRICSYLFRYKWALLFAVCLSMAANVLALIGPRLSGYAVDAIEFGTGKVDFRSIRFYCTWMVVCYAASAVISYTLSVTMLYITKKIVFTMRRELFDRLLDLPIRYFDRNQAGDIISRISYDIDTVNTSLSSDLVQIMASVITVTGSLIMMLLIAPELVLIFAVTVPLSIFLIRKITAKTRPLFHKRSRKLGELNGFIEEMLGGQKTLKAYDQQENTIQKFVVKNKEAVDAYYEADYAAAVVGPMVNFISNASIALVTMFGSILFLLHRMSLGDISSFVLYSRKFSGPINETANILSELQSALAAADRVFRLMDELPEKQDQEGAKLLEQVYGEVDLEHIDFGYVPEKQIIHDLTLKAEPGKLVAIVGPTGAGKTTIINLLMRFYDPDSGIIKVDGTPVEEITRNSLRKSYAMVLQDTWLFYGTIRDNIAYGKEDATMEEVVQAAKAACIHHYIMTLPQGYDTILSDDGVNISKGQKQLLTIARAMLLDAHMLILDEATSNVDTRTEMEIQRAMRRLMKDKTCFVIAHRLSTIRNADNILVVRDGEIVEMGNHEQLMALGGFYRQLYDSQFQ